jgi:hypothetical protein
MDIDSPSRPFASSSSSSQANTLHFGTNTPFIFHSAPRSPQYEPYDPSKWASKNFKFGFTGSGSGTGAEDVEMRFGDSPSRPDKRATHEEVDKANKRDEVEQDKNAASESKGKGGEKKQFDVGQAVDGEGESRKIASGAMTRVRRKRQKEWRRVGMIHSTDSVARSWSKQIGTSL